MNQLDRQIEELECSIDKDAGCWDVKPPKSVRKMMRREREQLEVLLRERDSMNSMQQQQHGQGISFNITININ